MNFFIVKQLPVLPPETYLEEACQEVRYVELVVPRDVGPYVYRSRFYRDSPKTWATTGLPLSLGRVSSPSASSASSTLSSPTCTNSTALIWSG